MDPERRPRVAIIGAGFGGLAAAKALKRAPVDVVVLDRENYHLFQPLVYQVAMAQLAANDISASIRAMLARQKNTRVLLGEVRWIDLDGRVLATQDGPVEYDYLVVAGGTRPNYFGKDGWESIAPSPKGLETALEIRKRVLFAFEEAEALEGTPPSADACSNSSSSAEGPRGSSSREPSRSCPVEAWRVTFDASIRPPPRCTSSRVGRACSRGFPKSFRGAPWSSSPSSGSSCTRAEGSSSSTPKA